MVDQIIAQPRHFHLPQVKLDIKKLFSKLGEAVAQVGVAETAADALPKVVSALFGAAEAISFSNTTTDEERAWGLIRNALVQAVSELVDESLPDILLDFDQDYVLRQFETFFSDAVTDGEVLISEGFFKNPTALPLLSAVQELLAGWLADCHLDKQIAQRIASRLPRYFSVALHQEWRNRRKDYEPLLLIFDTPFADAARWEQEWHSYRQFLLKEVTKSLLGQPFTLADVYVRLRAWYQKTEKGADDPSSTSQGTKVRAVVDLHKDTESWLTAANSEEAIRIISGGPGSGKSSFARMFVAERAEAGLRVLFIPLQHFSISGNFSAAMDDFFNRSGLFSKNPLNESGFAAVNSPLLLVFDGLDEMAKEGDAANAVASVFLRELRAAVFQWNYADDKYARVLALVTGRTASIQNTRDVVSVRDRHELHVLRYFIDKNDFRRSFGESEYSDPNGLLQADQRNEWWDKYASCNPNESKTIPPVLLGKDLQELSTEPLLNMLLVLSKYHLTPTDANNPVNRNSIYACLFEKVKDRPYAGLNPCYVLNKELDEHYDEVMEVVATAAWYGGDSRCATVAEVKAVCPKNLSCALEEFVTKRGLQRLVMGFYFQMSDGMARGEDQKSFEFTHKSFAEYLTARRLVRELEGIHGALGDRYNEGAALCDWTALTCRQPINENVLRFLRDEFRLRQGKEGGKELVGSWLTTSVRLFSYNLLHGTPVIGNKNPPVLDFRHAEALAANAELALLAVVNGCAEAIKTLASISWPNVDSARRMFFRINELNESKCLARACGGFLGMQDQNLEFMNLEGGRFFGADLTGANLTDATFTELR